MAKVGSSSIYVRLHELGLKPLHFHWINNAKGLISLTKKQFDQTSFKIITMARDPVSRNLSDFWAGHHRKPNNNTIKHLLREHSRWLKTGRYMQPLIWFDEQLKTYFNTDVYKTPFPKELGYEFYHNNNVKTLLIRTEDLTKVAPEAISKFLGTDFGSVGRLNSGKQPNNYLEFKKRLKMPSEYLDKMYNSKYAKHFYTEDEIESFYQKWHH